jgi:hypothetical protein
LVAHALADRLATFITAPDENQLATLLGSVRETVLLQAQARKFPRAILPVPFWLPGWERPPL